MLIDNLEDVFGLCLINFFVSLRTAIKTKRKIVRFPLFYLANEGQTNINVDFLLHNYAISSIYRLLNLWAIVMRKGLTNI